MKVVWLCALAMAALMGAGMGPATAQTAARAWVSGHGTDAPGCSAPTNPCRSFQYAHDNVVAAGGEIDVLDPGGYGAITITKAISIVNDGVGLAGVQAASGNAITINAGPGDIVNLRGLTLAGGAGSNEGVFMTGGGGLNVQNCVVRGFGGDGFGVLASNAADFNIQDTVISNVANNGIAFQPSGSGRVTVVVTRVLVTSAGSGIIVNGSGGTGTLNATIADSVFSDNNYGVSADSFSGDAPTKVMVVRSTIANNKVDGVYEQGSNSVMYLAKSSISGNATAFVTPTNGVIDSFGDNYIAGNGADGGALPIVAVK